VKNVELSSIFIKNAQKPKDTDELKILIPEFKKIGEILSFEQYFFMPTNIKKVKEFYMKFVKIVKDQYVYQKLMYFY